MINLSELEATEAHQADTIIIQDYPLVSFTTVSSEALYMTKTYSYDQESNDLIRERAGSPVDGMFYRVDNLSLHDLFEHFGYLTAKEALIHGTIKDHEQVCICTKDQPIDGCMTRTKDNFSYPDNALMLLDHDPSDRGYKISSADNFVDALELIDPQLKSCAYFYKSSASSGIRLNGKLLNDNTGIHVYLVIPGGQLKSYAEILFKRCILNDLGHIFISKNGRKYIRTIFDAAVHGPERIDYIAPAIINKPLEIDEPVSSSRPGNSIDGSLLSRLTPEEEVSYQDKRKKLLSDAEDDAFDVLYKYVKDQSKTTGIAAERLMRLHAMGDQGVIDFEHPLTKDNGDRFSFADVVATPDDYNNLSMRDPFDPGDGPSKAKLYINDHGTIVINSFAHGGTVYKLYQDGKLYAGNSATSKQPTLINHPLDEVGNASRLIEQHGDFIRYPSGLDDYNVKKWLIYNNTGWRNNTDGSIERLALATINSIVKEGHEIYSKTELKNHTKRSRKAAHIMNMLLVASWDEAVQIRGNDADDNPMLIGTLNGVVDLETGEIIQNSKEHFITKRVNASFDKEAKCPIWDKFLNRITGEDQDMIEYLNLLTSYLLTGKTNEHKLFIFHGPSFNGKTTWVGCIQDILGEYASQIPVESLSYTRSNAIDDNLSRTKGSRLTVTSEIKKGVRLNEPLIKQLTGGDRITARKMHKGSLEYKPASKFIMVVNDLPEITGSDKAIARRIEVVPFNQVIGPDEVDKSLPDKLKGEYDAIFTRAVLMCPEWQQHGLTQPKLVIEASTDYVESKDVFKCWKNDEVDTNASSEDFVSYDELITSHRVWCNDHSLNALNVNTFSTRLQACAGITKCKKRINSKQERGYKGVKLVA